MEMPLRGLHDINKVFIKSGKVNKFDENEGFKQEVEWMLDTEGVNLLAVMGHEDVDALRTTSNHGIEVLEVLGIEENHTTFFERKIMALLAVQGRF